MQAVIRLIGAVALLVWGLYMVKSGILRTFGEDLRVFLAERLHDRFSAFAAGAGLATLLQSSTATALLVANLQNKGLVTTAIALACVLGADLGSALVVRVLSLDLSALIPLLIFAGVLLFIRRSETRVGQFGRILLGLAFVMMALQMIVAATAPVRESEALREAFAAINDTPAAAAMLGVGLAIICFSSLAVVSIAAAVAAAGVMTLSAGLWVVLGANLGSALLALVSTAGGSAVVRRAPLGNAVFRAGGFLLGVGALTTCPWIGRHFTASPDDLVIFHVAYNAVVGVIGLCFIGPTAALVDRLLPSKEVFPSVEVKLLSGENLLSATTGLVMAGQEVEKTALFSLQLWQKMSVLLERNPPIGEILPLLERRRVIRRRCRAVERYLDVLIRKGLTTEESVRWQRVSAANDGLAAGAETLRLILESLAEKKCELNCFFTPEGLSELLSEHRDIADELQSLWVLLRDVGMTVKPSDPAAAAQRDARKAALIASIEARGQDSFNLVAQHMARVAQGRSGAIETSALHVDLVLLFRRFEAALNNMVRYL